MAEGNKEKKVQFETDSTTQLGQHNALDTKSVEAITTLLRSQNIKNEQSTITKVGVSFAKLTVSAPTTQTTYVKTLPRAILNTFGPDQWNFIKSVLWTKNGSKSTGSRELLSDFTGLVRPGEMLLVLGRPGSGCSTFLRTAANRSKLAVSGDLRYGNTSAEDFTKSHSRETIYLPEEDKHIASLSVRQTIRFALQMSVPKRKGSKVDLSSLTETIATIFGLGHALDTPVGGAFSPGVSGGERKRVSIAEVLAAGSSIQCFDNSTRGLDSSTALDFVKALRILTDIGQKTTMATLYQAGEELYSKFDKVLLIDAGHELFFGRTTEARAYFEELGFLSIEGQTTTEFLTAVTDTTQRSAKPGSAASSINTPYDLALAFKNSQHLQDLEKEIAQYREIVSSEDKLLPGTAFNLSFPTQILHCLSREHQLVYNQRRVHYVKWITTIILVLACGSVYFDITTDAQGAFTRGGILFFALILNGWMMFPELFDAHTNRSVLERQGQFPFALQVLALSNNS
jgi:ATP-binding cassette subfamily G (WHITE) protein 2 (SNQ2)